MKQGRTEVYQKNPTSAGETVKSGQASSSLTGSQEGSMAHLAGLVVDFLEMHLPCILKPQVCKAEVTVAKPAGGGEGRSTAAQGALRGRRRGACS